MTILYRMEGEPETGTELSFVDVPKDQYYTQAVIWAAEHQIVKGMDGTHYAPQWDDHPGADGYDVGPLCSL